MKKLSIFTLVALSIGGCDQLAEQQMDNIYDQVSSDAVEQYEIAKRQGDPIQVCVQAGFVAAAYLQAKNETNYSTWKTIEKADCARAGLPN